MRDRHTPFPIAAALWAAAMGLFFSTAQAEIRAPRGAIELGVDSFAQSYQLTDFTDSSLLSTALRDTSEVITEWRAAGEFDVQYRSDLWRVDLHSQLSAGTDLHRGRLSLGIDRVGEDSRLDIHLRSNGRLFRADSSYRLSSDTGEIDADVRWLRKITKSWQLGLRGSGELLRHERQSSYERNANTGSLAGVLRWESGWSNFAEVDFGYGHKSVPDSSAISYDRNFVRGIFAGRLGSAWDLRMESSVEQRRYAGSVRSDFTSLFVESSAEYRLNDFWALRWQLPLEWVDYAEANDVYFDAFFGRTGLELNHRRGELELGLEPRFTWLRTPAPREEEYVQSSVQVRAEWFSSGRLWFSLAEEVGMRDHRESTSDIYAFYSDFWFVRSSVSAGLRLKDNLTLEGFFTDEPESHRRHEDDTRLTLVSLSLRMSY